MTILISILKAVFWGLLVLSILVGVHEGGHFLAARAFGMRVTEFFLGLPCRFRLAWKSPRLGTEFGVTPFLLGGYNRICGMEGDDDPLLPKAFALVQEHGRIDAAEVANQLGIEEGEAYVLLATLVDRAAIRAYYNEELGEYKYQSDWPRAFETQQRDGKLLTEYDRGHDFTEPGTTAAGEPRSCEDYEAFLREETSRTYQGKGFIARVITLVAGPLVNIICAIAILVGSLMIIGVQTVANSNELGGVAVGSLAEQAGLEAGDRILQLGGQDVKDWVSLCDAIDKSLETGENIPVAYERDGETFETTIVMPEDEEVDVIGVSALVKTYHPGFVEAMSYALSYMAMVAATVVRLLMPTHTMEIVSQSSSIVGISAMASEAASSGLADLLYLAAAVSMSLGFMNLLPIPPLDGGKIVIEIIQLVIRRPLSTKAQNIVSYVGLAFFLFIFVFALRNDIVRLLGLT